MEYTIAGKTSLLEFASYIKFIISPKRRQIGHIFTRPEVGPTSYETPCRKYNYVTCNVNIPFFQFTSLTLFNFKREDRLQPELFTLLHFFLAMIR